MSPRSGCRRIGRLHRLHLRRAVPRSIRSSLQTVEHGRDRVADEKSSTMSMTIAGVLRSITHRRARPVLVAIDFPSSVKQWPGPWEIRPRDRATATAPARRESRRFIRSRSCSIDPAPESSPNVCAISYFFSSINSCPHSSDDLDGRASAHHGICSNAPCRGSLRPSIAGGSGKLQLRDQISRDSFPADPTPVPCVQMSSGRIREEEPSVQGHRLDRASGCRTP